MYHAGLVNALQRFQQRQRGRRKVKPRLHAVTGKRPTFDKLHHQVALEVRGPVRDLALIQKPHDAGDTQQPQRRDLSTKAAQVQRTELPQQLDSHHVPGQHVQRAMDHAKTAAPNDVEEFVATSEHPRPARPRRIHRPLAARFRARVCVRHGHTGCAGPEAVTWRKCGPENPNGQPWFA